jgi:hypothetical protein
MEDKMKKFFLTVIFAASMCVSCVATVGPYGTGVAIAPPLPATVELVDPYYVYGGYHYYYNNDRWYYSRSRDGRWIELPRDHYPREVRFKGQRDERDRKDDRGRGHEKGWRDDRGRGDERSREVKRRVGLFRVKPI